MHNRNMRIDEAIDGFLRTVEFEYGYSPNTVKAYRNDLRALTDAIVDIVETGSTLRENGLAVLEEVCSLSARMVVNQVSMKTENERITAIIKKFQAYLKENAGR